MELSIAGLLVFAGLVGFKAATRAISRRIVEGMPQKGLIWNIQAGNTGIVRQLLASGADPNETDKKGLSALYWAEFAEDREMVELLMQRGAPSGSSQARGPINK